MKKHLKKYFTVLVIIITLFTIFLYHRQIRIYFYPYNVNILAIKKPTPLVYIENKDQLKYYKQYAHLIIDGHKMRVGTALRKGGSMFYLIRKSDLKEYSLKYLTSQEQILYKKDFFKPNYMGQRAAKAMHLITSIDEAEDIKKHTFIYNHQKASIGSALSKSRSSDYINLISQDILTKEYVLKALE